MKIEVQYFNSLGTKDTKTLTILDDTLVIDSIELNKNSYMIQSPIVNIPIIIEINDGSRIEIPYSKEIVETLKNKGQVKKFSVFNLESNLKMFIGVLIVTVACLSIFFKVILPAGSKAIAKSIPNSWSAKLDEMILESLDKSILFETELQKSTQKKLTDIFKDHNLEKYNILFRKGNELGANAFALANSTIIITDELVEHINQGKLILSIVFHEVAHLEKKHVLSQLISDATLAFFSLYLYGDGVGSAEVVGELSFTLMAKGFSQDQELEADTLAAKRLIEHNFSPNCMTKALKKLISKPSKSKSDKKEEKSILSFLEIFSTHPSHIERKENIDKVFKSSKECVVAL